MKKLDIFQNCEMMKENWFHNWFNPTLLEVAKRHSSKRKPLLKAIEAFEVLFSVSALQIKTKAYFEINRERYILHQRRSSF